jgi:hypothetical protein
LILEDEVEGILLCSREKIQRKDSMERFREKIQWKDSEKRFNGKIQRKDSMERGQTLTIMGL